MKTVQLKVSGMSCGHCVGSVKQALESVPGVSQVEVSLSEGISTISGSDFEIAALIEAVKEEGYTAEITSG